MLRSPRTTFARLVLVMAGVLVAVVLIVLLSVRILAEQGVAGYADLVAGNVEAVRAGSPTRSARRAEWAGSQAPLPVVGFLQQGVSRRLVSTFGPGTQVGWGPDGGYELWIRPAGDAAWIAVRMPGVMRSSVWAITVFVLVGAGLVIAAAAWFAHGITRPLDALAASAPRLALDQLEPGLRLVPPDAPREVLVLESALRRAAEDVQATARERERMLTGVSHDLRTPLSRLRMALELQSGIPEQDRAELVGDLEEIDRIIGQFLDFVRDGREEASERVDVVPLLRGLVAEAARAGVVWGLRCPEHLVSELRPLALRRAVRNLMGNAEIYGASPRVITLELAAGQCLLQVIDHGPGVPAELLADLGKPFYRGNTSRSGLPGSGLGLALARRVALVHGGGLRVDSTAGKGFSVTMSWPQFGLGPAESAPSG